MSRLQSYLLWQFYQAVGCIEELLVTDSRFFFYLVPSMIVWFWFGKKQFVMLDPLNYWSEELWPGSISHASLTSGSSSSNFFLQVISRFQQQSYLLWQNSCVMVSVGKIYWSVRRIFVYICLFHYKRGRLPAYPFFFNSVCY